MCFEMSAEDRFDLCVLICHMKTCLTVCPLKTGLIMCLEGSLEDMFDRMCSQMPPEDRFDLCV